MSPPVDNLYEFGEFRFDGETRLLTRDGELVPIPPKASDVLYELLLEPGNLVERKRLIEAVWPDTFVEEGNLNHAVSALRKVLGSDAIRTVPRRGYQFKAEVRIAERYPAAVLTHEKRTVTSTFVAEHEEIEEVTDLQVRDQYPQPRKGVFVGALTTAALLIMIMAGTWVLVSSSSSSDAAGKRAFDSLAILPIRSFAEERTDVELRMRITDALITKLGTLDNLAVRPTNSIMPYADAGRDAQEAGRELGVDAVLDGRLQTEGERLRVTLQLISVETGEQLWSDQFDGRATDILGLQDSIAARFENDLELRDSNRPQRRAVVSSEAYEAYLKGRFLWNQRRKESYYRALEYFQTSVETDPGFALGYTGIADCYYLLQQRNELSTDDAMSKAEAAARRALELDPYLSEANSSMGAVSLIRYNRRQEAETYYKKAIELNPNLAEPYGRLGMLYNAMSRFDEAYTALKRAEELDPTSINIAIYLGANYYFSKDFDRAVRQFNRILEFAPDTERAHFFLTRIFEQTGQYDLAVEHALKERAVYNPGSVAPLREAYRQRGIRGFWQEQINILRKESETMFGLENHIASRYALLGDKAKACDYVEKNLDVGGSMMNYGGVDPLFDSLRSEPRFIELVARQDLSVE